MEYAVQPTDPTHILMTSIGVELSSRRRPDLAACAEVDRDVRTGRLGSEHPGLAYAVGFDSSIWRTTDGGKSWTAVS